MIPRDTLDQLAALRSPNGTAISFYFRRGAPENLSHQDETILIKDKVRELLGSLGDIQGSKSGEDLRRILGVADGLRTSSARGKVVFACKDQEIWQEFDVDGLPETRLTSGSYFELLPALAAHRDEPRCCIVVLDREKTRVFKMQGDAIGEYSWVIDEDEGFKVRNTGTKGSSQSERQKEEPVKQHFKFVGEHLQYFFEHGDYDLLLIGTRDELWPEIEARLPSSVLQILAGKFHADPGAITIQEIQEQSRKMLEERRSSELRELLQTVYGEAQRNGLGAVGVRNVADALEKGEVEALFIGDTNLGPVAECTNCGHITPSNAAKCEICNRDTLLFSNAAECLARKALASENIDVQVLWDDARLKGLGGVAAQLRFRAEQNTPQKLAS
ncbi:MAG TPA: hypothetical protein VFZ99_02975 [Terriglobales bacterium]